MDQIKIGNFIASKRKEKNLTQEQLAEKIGVSNKTISKWECGRCMPDYSLIENLCKELNISVSELINGHSFKSCMNVDNESVLQLVKEIELLKVHNVEVDGILLLLLSLVTYCIVPSSTQFGSILLNIVSLAAAVFGFVAVIWGYIRKRKIKK